MKTLLKILAGVIGVLVLLAIIGASVVHFRGIPSYETKQVDLKVEITPERIAEGQRLASMLCKSCHYNSETGKFTGKHMKDAPPEFGTIYSVNITQDPDVGIGGYTDGELAFMLRTGIKKNGQYAPPYMPKLINLSDEDLYSVIAFLKSDHEWVQPLQVEAPASQPSFLTKALCNTVMKPFEYPESGVAAPDTSDLIAYGRYLVVGKYDCFGCHSQDFKTVDYHTPENSPGYLGGGNLMLNMEGEVRYTANITFDQETGIGTYSLEDFSNTVRFGQKPDGTTTRYPMLPFTRLTDQEIRAMYEYLKTVPPIKHDVKSLYAES